MNTLTKEKITLDYKQISDIEIGGINHRDAPKFCDAYISSATYMGRDMTDDELEVLNDNSGFVHECVQDWIY
jgi:hypothetical protein